MKKIYWLAVGIIVLGSCKKTDIADSASAESNRNTAATSAERQESTSFTEIGMIDIGNTGAAEISAYDPITKKLFVVNNSTNDNKIDVINLANPASPVYLSSISVTPYGGLVNSVYVSNGKVAAAIEALDKTNPGKVVVFKTTNHSEIAVRTVGSLPDMITFSPDGKLILTANEGEPNQAYTIDPMGTVSIIEVDNNYAVTTLNFSGFASQAAALKLKGLRIYGPNASFAQDIEPEYVAVASNSKTAWVTLQENNAIGKIDLETKTITEIFPLGFKNFNTDENAIDPSDNDGGVFFNKWPVKGIYTPDAIAVIPSNGAPFLFTANEGDAREYTAYVEARRVNAASVILDPVAFPNAAVDFKPNTKLGRLNITPTLGDTDGDGDFDELYAPGARSFSIWNGNTGALVFDSKNELDKKAFDAGRYADSRSDDKGTEPEGIAIGRVGNKNMLFVGMERADAVAVYDITNPIKPVFLKILNCGVGPEGVLFVDADKSPNGKSMLIVSSEVDGVIKIFSTEL